jgi:quercetin dioxygenase-like cupin family protein
LSGKLLVHADGHVATIREGGLVHVSCGMPHTFATTPDTPARFLLLSTTRPDPMTAPLAGRHRHASSPSFVDDPARRT